MSNVIPIRNLHGEASKLAEHVCKIVGSIPADEFVQRGYRLTPETRADLQHAIRLLKDVYQVLREVQERENPIFSASGDRLETKEAEPSARAALGVCSPSGK